MIAPSRWVCFLLAAAAPAVLAATMYKWTDANGNVHFTQEPPPPGIQGQKLAPPPPPAESPAKAQAHVKKLEQQFNATQQQRQDQAKKAEQEAHYDAEKKQKCAQAKQRLQKAQRPRVSFVNPDGTVRRATEEERQQQIHDSEKQVKKFCD